MAWIAAGEGEPPAIALTDPIRATGEAVRGDIILPTGEGMLRKAGCAMLISPASAYYSARSMMLLANSAVISEAAGSPAWKRALEPNSWQFGASRRHSQPQSRPRQTCRPPSKPSRALPAVPSWVSIRITVLNGPEPPARLRSIPNGLTIELDGAASPYSRRTPYPTCGRPSPPRHISRAADKDGTSHRPVLRKGLS
jgi:hypothetical protein